MSVFATTSFELDEPWRYDPDLGSSWFDLATWDCGPGWDAMPRLCPPHLPVFGVVGVVEESRDG